ncbi:MAG: hypothetical protein WCF26_25055 [Candidatus Sulfotelmatobacter sp.]
MSIKFGARILVYFTLASAFSLLSAGQQNATPPANADSSTQAQPQDSTAGKTTPSAQTPASQDKNKDQTSAQPSGQGKVAGTSNDRLFYTLPNFLTLQGAGQLPPLSAKDKFKVVALGTFDYVEYPWWGLLAAVSQADDSEPGYGQGWVGYAKRYGTTMGDSTVENFMVGAVFPSILHEDPRYYQSGRGGFFTRSGYAVSRIVVTRSDSGRPQFNYSEIFGSAVAAGISTYSYHPRSTYMSTPTNPHLFVPSDRTLSNSASVWGTQVGLDTFTIMVKEFWPDIHRKLSHKSHAAPAAWVSPETRPVELARSLEPTP